MLRKNPIDNKFFFPVPPNIQNGIESRKKKKNGLDSPIGLGPVPATVVKDSTSNVCELFDICLSQIKDMGEKDDSWLYSNFFPYPEPKDVTKRVEGRNEVEKETVKRFKASNEDATPVHAEPHKAVKAYLEYCYEQWKYGCVGLLPSYMQNIKFMSNDVEEFIKTQEGKVLQHFCMQMLK